MWDINPELVERWLLSLDEDSYAQVIAALRILANEGPALGRPVVDTVKGSRFKNMKELRPGSSGLSKIRILFAFDPRRKAILLVAGDKRGSWQKWYRENIPVAEALYEAHLQLLKQGEDDG